MQLILAKIGFYVHIGLIESLSHTYPATEEWTEAKTVGELRMMEDSVQQWRLRIMNVPQSVVAETNLVGRPLLIIILSQIYSRQLRVKNIWSKFSWLAQLCTQNEVATPQNFAERVSQLIK